MLTLSRRPSDTEVTLKGGMVSLHGFARVGSDVRIALPFVLRPGVDPTQLRASTQLTTTTVMQRSDAYAVVPLLFRLSSAFFRRSS